jgi:hypothetical protein
LIKKLPNCKGDSSNIKTFFITIEYETIRKNIKRETVEVAGEDEVSAGANFMLWRVINHDIRGKGIKRKNAKLIEIKENKNKIQSNPL